MAIFWQNMKWLMWLKKSGAIEFDNVITLGRLNLYMEPREIEDLSRHFGFEEAAREHLVPRPKYCEPFFEMLGASTVDSMDASDYEDATVVHNLNDPIPKELDAKYDLVFDGGTMEHVFNFPEALRNAMRLVKPGGSLVIHQCLANMMGHGFYCFSPEVFYRSLCEENGFQVKNVRFHEWFPRAPWRRLPDPLEVRKRLLMIAFGLESQIFVHAVRVEEKPIFETWPHQSDYLLAWEGDTSASHAESSQVRLGVKTSGLGAILVPLLKPLRNLALHSAFVGRMGKYWLNLRNFTVHAQRKLLAIDDPMKGGGPANK